MIFVILDYYPLIWINNTTKQDDNIESVQNNFLKYMSFKLNIHGPPHGSSDNVFNYLSLIPLKIRRLQLFSKFLHKLISGLIDCSDLLYLINFKIHSFNIRNPEHFYLVHSDKKYILNCPANQLMLTGNNFPFNFN